MIRDSLLSEYIEEKAKEEFKWGKCDCALFAANWCAVSVGKDPASEFRGKYKTEIGAKRALLKYGNIIETLDKNFKQVNPNFAQKGDLCICKLDLGLTVGIVGTGGKTWFKTQDNGVIFLNVEKLKVWRVE